MPWQHCEHTRIPDDERCPGCSAAQEWSPASGAATLWSWTTFHREYYPGYPLKPPYTVLMVELEEGVRMLGTLDPQIPPDQLRCGMQLEFIALDLGGAFRIPGFAPVS